MSSSTDQTALLQELLGAIKTLQLNQSQLASNVDSINGRINVLAGVKEIKQNANVNGTTSQAPAPKQDLRPSSPLQDEKIPDSPSLPAQIPTTAAGARKTSTSGTSRIILTYVLSMISVWEGILIEFSTYPGQSGVNPFPLAWGEKDPQVRGPVVVSRDSETVRRRNGKYCILVEWKFANVLLAIGGELFRFVD